MGMESGIVFLIGVVSNKDYFIVIRLRMHPAARAVLR